MRISDNYGVYLTLSYGIYFIYFVLLSIFFFTNNITDFSLNNILKTLNLTLIAVLSYFIWLIFYFTEFKRKYFGLESIYIYLKELALVMPIYGWLLIIIYSLIVFISLPAYLIVKKLPFLGNFVTTTYYCNSCELTSTIKTEVELNNNCKLACKYCDSLEYMPYKDLIEKEKILSTFIADLILIIFFSILIDQIFINRNGTYPYSQGEENFVLLIAYVIPLTLLFLNFNYIFTTWLKEKITQLFEKTSP
ncbi:MAG: hypothetical protein HeimC3_06580 [Candidatus Heimdallarchaeota archaeon LC_3]|nr:MAG: hypothetical protein HeimC3_06580 [Candidatus Heimdallarchaeota archaeon LC_3]